MMSRGGELLVFSITRWILDIITWLGTDGMRGVTVWQVASTSIVCVTVMTRSSEKL
jgi:hypothetical protein